MLSFSIITNFLGFIILLMPISIVWTLPLSLKQCLAVIKLFVMGFFVCVARIVPATYVKEALVKSHNVWVATFDYQCD